MRIALNATSVITGGGVTYWLNFLPVLAALGAPHEYIVLLGTHQERLGLDLPANFHVERIAFGQPVALRRMVWEQTGLPSILRRRGADVLLAPGDIAPFICPCPVVLAVRNPNPYWGPRGSNWKARLRDRALRVITRLSAARSAHVFFVSADSRRRITPILRIPDAKSSVIYHGIGRRFLERGAPGPDDAVGLPAAPYILSVSAVRIHKDYETLVRAFAVLKRDVTACRDMRLVIVGAIIDPPYYERLRTLIAELALGDAATFLGEIHYEKVHTLYRGASVFVLPSLAETFGHPLVEAMASGVPVVTTDLEVTREVCESAAGYFRPGDARSLVAEIENLVSNDGLRQSRIAAGLERARSFSWERTVRQTLDLLESAAVRRQGTLA